MSASTKMPVADGMPILGSIIPLSRNLLDFMLSQYQKHGAVFQVNLFHKKYYTFAGPKANEFMRKQGMEFLTTERAWSGFSDTFNAKKFIISSEGSDHFEMRRIMRRGYSPSMLTDKMQAACQVINEEIHMLKVGDVFPVVDMTRRIVVRQLGILLANYDPNDYYDDLKIFTNYILNMVSKRWLGINKYAPTFVKARKRALEMAQLVIEDHKRPHTDRPPDLIDDILAAKLNDKSFFDKNEMIGATLGPFLAGMDTVVNTLSYMLYSTYKSPNIMAQVQTEANDLFKNGHPDLKNMRRASTIHKVALETMRMYPVAPMLVRTASKDFEFENQQIKKGDDIFLVSVLTHYLEECFPNPTVFDINRYDPPTNAHKNPINYVPFGIGTHTCLGNRLAEVLLGLNFSYLVHHLDMELENPNYKITMNPNPVPGPGQDFRLRVTNKKKMAD